MTNKRKRNRISVGSGAKKSKAIPVVRPKELHISFSFKHLDLGTKPKFSLDNAVDGYRNTLLVRLRDLSRLSVGEFVNDRSKTLRSHYIDFSKTTEPDGFSHLNEQVWSDKPWQFALTANAHGRVHGFIVGSIFFIVWLDPAHNLYA